MFRTLSPDPNALVLRDALGQFATGVAVVTAMRDAGSPVGVTINSFTSVSLTPPLLSWCVDRRAGSYQVFAAARHFCISVLSDDQAHLARHFASRGEGKYHSINGDGPVPTIEGACAYFFCETSHRILLGDHLMLVGRITEFEKQTRSPLLFVRGEFLPLPTGPILEIAA
jgi:flavin reductase (DIM6/NTAB) family NADH-FMN oxidoreductase RutF